jgi:hypothetical protein
MAASPGAGHKRLAVFVGEWKTEGTIRPIESGESVRFSARDWYEWLPGEFFLVHRWDAHMPEGRSQGIELMGYDPASDSYPIHTFDNKGEASVMEGRVEGDTWTLTGDVLRFTGGPRDGHDTIAGQWEQRERKDAPWKPLMDVTLTRVS